MLKIKRVYDNINKVKGGKAVQLLLVEDNVNIAKGLVYSLEQKGYKVIHTENIQKTIEILANR